MAGWRNAILLLFEKIHYLYIPKPFWTMNLRVIKDSDGKCTGVFIPMEQWSQLVKKHTELKELVPADAIASKRKSAITHALSEAEADEALFKYFD